MAEPKPLVYNFFQDGAAYLNAVDSDQTIEITRDTYEYFLEVLPPVYLLRTVAIDGHPRIVDFGFADGCERITAFWREQRNGETRYFCQRTCQLNTV